MSVNQIVYVIINIEIRLDFIFKAIVYLNPDIDTDRIRQFIIVCFGLTEENGIESVRFVADGSRHYQYKIDITVRSRNGIYIFICKL